MGRRGEDLIEGKLQHKGHFGFLISEQEGGRDVYVSGPTLKLAMDGDRVAVRIVGNRGGKVSGEIARVITQTRVGHPLMEAIAPRHSRGRSPAFNPSSTVRAWMDGKAIPSTGASPTA